MHYQHYTMKQKKMYMVWYRSFSYILKQHTFITVMNIRQQKVEDQAQMVTKHKRQVQFFSRTEPKFVAGAKLHLAPNQPFSSLKKRFKEHQKAPSPIFDLFNTTGHSKSVDNFSIVGREDQNLRRAIKKALYIRVNNPSLNRNIGKYHLPHIWDEVLFNIPELKLK